MQNEQSTVFVGNLSFSISKDELREVFQKFGEIVDISMPIDRETGRLKGFAFIQFDSVQAAQRALTMDGKECARRPMRVNLAHGKKETSAPNNRSEWRRKP